MQRRKNLNSPESNGTELTFREKMREHWTKRDFEPKKTNINKMLITMFWLLVISSVIETVFIFIPTLYAESGHEIFIKMFTWYMFVEVVLYWWFSYRDMANYVRPETKLRVESLFNDKPEGWHSCVKCQVDSPPRSYHCDLCGRCILKRDHHCFMTGSCVGLYNQRHFIFFLFFAIINTVTLIYLQLAYLNEDIPLLSWHFLDYIPPITFYRWITGTLAFRTIFIIVHVYANIFGWFTAVFFFLWQTLLVVFGKTTHEAWKRITPYAAGSTRANISSVFGDWKLIPLYLIYPFKFPLKDDGLTYKTKDH